MRDEHSISYAIVMKTGRLGSSLRLIVCTAHARLSYFIVLNGSLCFFIYTFFQVQRPDVPALRQRKKERKKEKDNGNGEHSKNVQHPIHLLFNITLITCN